MTGKVLIFFIASAVVSLSFLAWKFTSRGAYESAEYTVIASDRSFEIREYPDLMMATTNMRFESQGDDGSFMRLFRYISGANDTDQKVAMTTPVFMDPQPSDAPGQMAFVLPKGVSQQRVPVPSDEDVQIRKRPGGRFAVVRFSGRLNGETVGRARQELRCWMRGKELVADSDAEYAGYDPPWTPGPFRRNEILIRLK